MTRRATLKESKHADRSGSGTFQIHTLKFMSGSIPFARTVRSLDADGFSVSKLGLLLVAGLIAGWTWWMLGARVPQYEISENVRLELDRPVAEFPQAAQVRIHTGQAAQIRLNGQEAIQTQVASVANKPGTGQIRVEFNPIHSPSQQLLRAEVEVERVSPAVIALRATGRANR